MKLDINFNSTYKNRCNYLTCAPSGQRRI